MKFGAVAAAASFTLLRSVLATPLDGRAASPNVVTIFITETITTYKIHLKGKYKYNGVYSWDQNWSLTVTNAPTSVNIYTSATSTDYATSTSSSGGKGKKITSTSYLTVGGLLSTVEVSTSQASSSATLTKAASTKASSTSTSKPAASTSSTAVRASSTKVNSMIPTTAKTSSAKTTSTIKSTSTKSTNLSSTTTSASSAAATCGVHADDITDLGWSTSAGNQPASSWMDCYKICLVNRYCQSFAFATNGVMASGQECIIMNAPISRSGIYTNVGSATGDFILYQPSCTPAPAASPVVKSSQRCNETFNNMGGPSVWSLLNAMVAERGSSTAKDCQALCVFLDGYCASWAWYPGDYESCKIIGVPMEYTGAYEDMGNVGGDGGWTGVASDVGCPLIS